MNKDPDALYLSPLGGKYDPLTVYRKLLIQSNNKINDLLSDWQNTEDALVSAKAEDTLISVTRSVFCLKGVSEPDGVTDCRVLETLTHYLDYTEKKG